jgi:hypothetical protein
VWLYPLLTSATDGSDASTSRFDCFIPAERTTLTIARKAGWAPELVLDFSRSDKSPASVGNRTA